MSTEKYCCKKLNEMVNRFDFIQEHNHYDEKQRYYEVIIGRTNDKGLIKQDIYYCPWCGNKLPIPYDVKNSEDWWGRKE